MAVLKVTEAAGREGEHPLSPDSVCTIGRAADNTCVLDDSQASPSRPHRPSRGAFCSSTAASWAGRSSAAPTTCTSTGRPASAGGRRTPSHRGSPHGSRRCRPGAPPAADYDDDPLSRLQAPGLHRGDPRGVLEAEPPRARRRTSGRAQAQGRDPHPALRDEHRAQLRLHPRYHLREGGGHPLARHPGRSRPGAPHRARDDAGGRRAAVQGRRHEGAGSRARGQGHQDDHRSHDHAQGDAGAGRAPSQTRPPTGAAPWSRSSPRGVHHPRRSSPTRRSTARFTTGFDPLTCSAGTI